MAWIGVITNAGRDLFGSYAANGLSLSVDTVKVGSGTMPPEDMRSSTALVTEKASGEVVGQSAVTGGAVFRMQVGPASTESYIMKEMGLFVNATDGVETTTTMVAYFIEDSDGVAVPLAENFPDFVYILAATLAINNDVSIALTVNPHAYASFADINNCNTEIAKKVNKPSGDGTNGQFLMTNGDGTTAWTSYATPSDAQIATAVAAWLDDHPEATTTVQDGSVTRAKLHSDLQAEIDAPGEMIGPEFDEDEPNDPETYVTKDGKFYYLPDGHEEDATWANTTKEETTIAAQLKRATMMTVTLIDGDDYQINL